MSRTPTVVFFGLWSVVACSSSTEPPGTSSAQTTGGAPIETTTSLSTSTTSATTGSEEGSTTSTTGVTANVGAGGSTATTTSGMVSTTSVGGGASTEGGTVGMTSMGTMTSVGGMGGVGGAGDPTTTGGGGSGPGGMSTSPGCGTATSLSSGNATIDVSGTQRDYILKIPDNYDSSNPYKLVFGLHWRGGQASDVSSGTIGLGDYYGLDALAQGSAIFVAPNGIDNGWANTGGRDTAFMNALLDLFESELCIDLDRIFSVGFSYGGMMSFSIACDMADRFRAVAPLSGALYSGCGNGTEPIALWGAHGLSDDVVPINDGRSGLQEVLNRNNCGDATTATEPSPCVSYEGCDEGYPVTWCEFDGGHSPQQWQSQPIWDFFSQF